MKKILLLFFALLLPVLIFLFLKSFGKNEFEVPVLYTDSVTVPESCNAYTYKIPYRIPDSLLREISQSSQDTLTIVVFEDGIKKNYHERGIHIERIFTEFKKEPLHVTRIFKNQIVTDLKQKRLTNTLRSAEEFKMLHDCIFLLNSENDAVILDHLGRIRGQYNLTKRNDADRMIMQEMNILFKRY